MASLLDTDLYKLTMQAAVLRHFPDAHVAYRFTDRGALRFPPAAREALRQAVARLEQLALSADEAAWLRQRCPFLPESYVRFLHGFRFRPAQQVQLDTDADGRLSVHVTGLWREVILYEVPLMAAICEVYYTHVDTQWDMRGQRARAEQKARTLSQAGIRFSEFGTRRRRSYATHVAVLEGLIRGAASGPGALMGTSNVHLARLYDLVPIGTVAHEWHMAVAALRGYDSANVAALQLWEELYAPPAFEAKSPAHDLRIALTDTFSSEVFFRDLLGSEEGKKMARGWRGLRQDSGDPAHFVRRAKEVYDALGVDSQQKFVVFSDGLNVARCLELQKVAQDVGIGASFGIGTSLTNDFAAKATPSPDAYVDSLVDEDDTAPRSKALNIVLKLHSIEGRACVKISDELSKNSGDPSEVAAVKRRFGIEVAADATEDA